MSADKYPNIFSNSRQIKAIVYLFVLFILLAVRYFQERYSRFPDKPIIPDRSERIVNVSA